MPLNETRIVNVTLTRQDNTPNRRGFGTPLIVSHVVSDNVAAAVDATTRVKSYSSLAAVAVDWTTASGAYIAAQDAFQQSPAPTQIKIGFVAPASITADMVILNNFDSGFYMVCPTAVGAPWHDVSADIMEFANWIESNNKMGAFLSTDANTQILANITSIAAVLQASGLRRSFVAYHNDATANSSLHVAIAAYLSTRNYDDAGSAYTVKFKRLRGIPLVDLQGSQVQIVTGFTPGLGLTTAAGKYANTYVDVGGVQHVTEGTLADGSFIDTLHFEDWLIARTQEEVLTVFANAASVPYTDKGFDMIGQAVQRVLTRSKDAGAIADYDNTEGRRVPWDVNIPRRNTVADAQAVQRIMPAISVTFKYSGSVHYSTVNYTMTF